MTEKKRICETCAWWENVDPFKDMDPNPGQIFEGVCHLNPQGVDVNSDWWCRHWSETTGWGVFKRAPTPLEQQAFEIFQRNYPDPRVATLDIQQWLEDYTRKC